MVLSQEELNERIATLISHEIRLAAVAAKLRKRDDPAAFEREHEVMMLQNCIYALRDYPLTDDLLTETEVRVPYEIGLQISLNWPRT